MAVWFCDSESAGIATWSRRYVYFGYPSVNSHRKGEKLADIYLQYSKVDVQLLAKRARRHKSPEWKCSF